jgi:hypothetical protein
MLVYIHDKNEASKSTGTMDQPEQFVNAVFATNPDAEQRKKELMDLLNADPFDRDLFRKLVEDFQKQTADNKGYDGEHMHIATCVGKHGTLTIRYFQKSDSVCFGFAGLH